MNSVLLRAGESSSPEQETVGGAGRGATNGRTLSQWAEAVDDTEKERGLDNMEESVVLRTGKNQGVLRCRLCPKTICLSENTMRAHLSSKVRLALECPSCRHLV